MSDKDSEAKPETVGVDTPEADEAADVASESEVTDIEADSASPESDVAELFAAKPKERRQVSLRSVALVGAFVVLLGAVGFLGGKVWQQRQLNTASAEAQSAAVKYAQVLTSIDSDKVDENFKQVLDGATGEFKDMYSQSSVELRQLLIENKAAAHGVVIESAVQSIAKNKAVVLLFVDQSVSNTKLPDPRIDRSRMKMTLEKIDGAWRTSKVELP